MRSFVLVVLLASTASAETITGDVTDVTSRWTDDGSRIVTDAKVQTQAGEVVVSQLGGSVGGLTMRTFPGPAILDVGMRVTVTAHRDRDLENTQYVVVDDVKVLEARQDFVR